MKKLLILLFVIVLAASALCGAAAGEAIYADWPTLYAEYQARLMDDTSAFTENPDSAILTLDLMAGDLDLAFTNGFFSPHAEDASIVVFEMFGYEDVVYAEDGGAAFIEGVDSEGNLNRFEVHFGGDDTAVMFKYVNGERESELSLCVTDEYIGKIYKDLRPDREETVCAIVKPDGDVWLGIDEAVLDVTLYQNAGAAADPSFATSLPESYTYIGGVFTEN